MKLLSLLIIVLTLNACTAQMKVKNALTERGYVALREFQMGQVLHWIPEESQLIPIATLQTTPKSYGAVDELRVKFKSGVVFNGGANISREQEVKLETEVASRTSTVLTKAKTSAFDEITTAVINDWNARPEIWLNELGISDRGWPKDGAPIFVAVLYKQTLANKLAVEVDERNAVGAEFTSSISTTSGAVKFTIEDAASLEIEGTQTPVFFDFAVIRIRNTEEGPKFSHVRNQEVRLALSEFILN